MKYIVIGLGSYGSKLAEELTILGHEVIGVDADVNRVDAIKDKVTTSFILDASDEESLKVLPISGVDVVIVAIGENFGASIKIVALVKKFKAKHIYARAVDDTHKSVLEAFALDSILSPEIEAAQNLAKLLDLNIHVESFKIDRDHYVMKFKIPKSFVGFKVSDTAIESEFNLKVISIVKGEKLYNSIGISILKRGVDSKSDANYLLSADDQLVCYGNYKDFMTFWKSV